VRVLRPSDRAPGLVLDDDVVLPHDVELGANVVIHPGVELGAGVRVQDGAIVGKPVVLSRTSQTSLREPEPTVIGDGATIAAQAVVVAGASIGSGAFIGDQSHVRERARIGTDSMVGRGSAVDNDVGIGERVRMQTGCYVTAFSTIEDDVFIGPGVYTYNDNTMGRHRKGVGVVGVVLRRACRVGGGARILPGVEVGEEAFVATGSVVTRNVPARTLVMGVPARRVRDVGDEELIENWR
jgi:acetyltransferase-like isoleucine patch superfamily enzyme